MRTKIPMLVRDTAVPLSQLGFATAYIAEHLWSESVAFRLPDDWLVNVKERATVHLDFAYLSGMPSGGAQAQA